MAPGLCEAAGPLAIHNEILKYEGQKMKTFLASMCAALLLVSFIGQCKKDDCRDVRYVHDITAPIYDDFKYNQTWMPVPGVTTENELDRLDPRGPSTENTFNSAFEKRIANKSFYVDAIWSYLSRTRVSYENGDSHGYDETEVFELFVFLYKGVVQATYIKHNLRKIGEREWTPGPFQTQPIAFAYPGAREDSERYWRQRTLTDRVRHQQESKEELAEYNRRRAVGEECP